MANDYAKLILALERAGQEFSNPLPVDVLQGYCRQAAAALREKSAPHTYDMMRVEIGKALILLGRQLGAPDG